MLLWPQDVLLNLALRSSKSSRLLECKRYFRNIASTQTFLAHLWETQYDTAPRWPIPIWPFISFSVFFLNIQQSTRCLPWMSSQLKFNSKIQFITTTHSWYSYYLKMWLLDKRDKTNLLSLSFPFQKWYMNFSFFFFFILLWARGLPSSAAIAQSAPNPAIHFLTSGPFLMEVHSSNFPLLGLLGLKWALKCSFECSFLRSNFEIYRRKGKELESGRNGEVAI